MVTSFEVLLRHAEKFGVDGILDMAIDMGYEADYIAELLVRLDDIHAKQLDDKKKKRELGLTGIAPKYKRTPIERVEARIEELKK